MDKLAEILSLMQGRMEQHEKTLQHMLKQQKDTSDSFLRALEKMEDYRSGAPKQAPGEVVQQYGNRLYDISVDGQIWKRHANQLRLRFSSNPNITETPTELVELPLLPMSRSAHVTEEASSMLPTTTVEARPPQAIAGERRTRSRRPPERLMVDPKKKTYA
ncbi:hypothetical protein V3C99_012896 [Haemonchus contortus]|uniref:WRKY domain-containing protein n=1 Tax=Haemonchus contortus TaxID=6289 RepID=A0A7I4Z1V0_HAECO